MGDFSILVLDDDIYSLENIKLALADFNEYNVVTAADSRAAKKLLKQNKFNLLITDLRLPCKDGLEFAEEAKKKGLINDAILITGFGDEKTIEKAIKIGIRDFLRKPYEETEFLNSVRKVYENYLLKLENEGRSSRGAIYLSPLDAPVGRWFFKLAKSIQIRSKRPVRLYNLVGL